MTHKIDVDWDLCESYGVCVSAAPDLFDLDDDDNLLVLVDEVGDHQVAELQDAITRCPKKALAMRSATPAAG